MTPIPDYYEILGISPTASFAEIRVAYLKRAAECHPDRGGSHKAMKLVNEAWEILSNPATRERYDAARVMNSDASARAAAAEDIRTAAEAAAKYPSTWADFVKANYEAAELWGAPVPRSIDSYSGWFFIGTGALLGVLLSAGAIWYWLPQMWQASAAMPLLRIAFFPAVAGAWLGVAVHGLLRHRVESRDCAAATLQSSGATYQITHCPSCKKKLRLPKSSQQLQVTCPACHRKFTHGPPMNAKKRSTSFTFRLLVILHLIVVAVGAAVPWAQLLPSELQVWHYSYTPLEQDAAVAQSILSLLVLVIIILLLSVYVVALVALILLRPWGLWLFISMAALSLYLAAIGGPHVYSGGELVCDQLCSLLAGAIIAVGLLTDVLHPSCDL